MTIRWRFADWSLRARMAVLLVGTSLLPLLLWAYVDLRQDQARLLEGAKQLLAARGDQIVHELDAFHRGYRRAADRVARFPDVADYCLGTKEHRAARHAAVLGLLAAYPASDAGIRGAALLDGAGRVVIATEAQLVGVDLSDRPNVQAALRGAAVVTDPFISPPASGSVPTVAYFAPRQGSDGRVICVAVLWVRAAALWDTVKASDALAGLGSFAVVFDREGIRIAHTYNDDIVFHPGGKLDAGTLEKLVAERRFGPRTRALLEDVRAFPEQFERARAVAPDTSVFRGFAPASESWTYGVARRSQTVPWTVFYMMPETTITSQMAQATRERVLLAAAVIAAAGALGLLFAASIVRSIRALSRAAASIAGGDLAARVQASRGDEVGQLGTSFNAMAEQVQAQATSLLHSRDELELRVRERTAALEHEMVERVRVEQALHRAQVVTKLAHVITRPDGSFETWSETMPSFIGVEPTQMPQSTREWLSLLHPQDRQTFRSASIAAGVSGTRKDVEYRLRHPDGTWVHVRQVIEPIPGQVPDASGRMRWFSTLQNVDEQKQAEKDVRESQQRLQSIVDTALDAVITMDAAGFVTGWSPQAETTFGWSRNEALGRSLAETIIPPQHREAHRRGLERYLATGEGVVLNKRIELTALRRDGSEFPIEISITPMRSGDASGFSAFVRDITEHKQVQARLQAQLERLTLLDQITRAIGERQDLQSIYQVAIRSLEERLPVDFGCICRYDGHDQALTVIRVGAHSQVLALALALDEEASIAIDQNGLSRCVRGELVYEPDIAGASFPFSQRLARGGLRSLVVAPLLSESRVFGILMVARRQPDAFSSGECEFLLQLSSHVALAAQQAQLHDALQQAYDDLRQSQQVVMQQERLRAMGQMASGIAHDINNAISPAALYTETLLEHEPNLSERGRGYLVTISRAIDDVAATVARMREFYRQREPQLVLAPVQLNPLVQQVIDLTKARWSDMSLQSGAVIRVELDLLPGLPNILGIESEVREALINLVFNAVDAMPAGGVLTLRTGCTEAAAQGGEAGAEGGARQALVEVADTGVGMDEDTRRRCLEPFFTTKGERGTGLGLAMVFGVAQRHGAEIDVDSVAGHGTAVRLRFPVPVIAPAAAAVAAPPEVPSASLRILIVDDDPLTLRALGDTLEFDGHSVVAANGGQAGIDALQAARGAAAAFDVVITDLGMPYVDGREVARAAKAGDATVPVILLTGWGQRLLADGEELANVDRILSKPPKPREVRAALAQLVPRAHPAPAADSTREST